MERPEFIELNIETNESFLLGGDSFKVEDPGMGRFSSWRIAKNGLPHPQICPTCGCVVKRWPTDISHFKMHRQDLDVSWSYDGFLFVHEITLKMFADLGVTLPVLGFWKKHVAIVDVDGIPACEVDVNASGVRISDFCGTCQRFATVLLGRTDTIPPRPMPLVIASHVGPRELRATNLHFGSTHGQSPALIAGHELWQGILDSKL